MIRRRRIAVLLAVAAILLAAATVLIYRQLRAPEREAALQPAGEEAVLTVMDFSQAVPLDPLPPGWHHRTFLTRAAGELSYATVDGVPALRFSTDDSASMLVRFTDIRLDRYPVLEWRWRVEQPIESGIDETTAAGDDHPARLFLRFETAAGERRAMEIVWGNDRLHRGDFKYIDGFPHYVARGAEAAIGRWYSEALDLRPLVEKFWPGLSTLRLTEIALFCDSDETDSESVAYFAAVGLRRAELP